MNQQVGLALGLLALVGAIISGARLWQKHLDDTTAMCARVEQLEQIEISEHPDYSRTIYYRGAKVCP